MTQIFTFSIKFALIKFVSYWRETDQNKPHTEQINEQNFSLGDSFGLGLKENDNISAEIYLIKGTNPAMAKHTESVFQTEGQ